MGQRAPGARSGLCSRLQEAPRSAGRVLTRHVRLAQFPDGALKVACARCGQLACRQAALRCLRARHAAPAPLSQRTNRTLQNTASPPPSG